MNKTDKDLMMTLSTEVGDSSMRIRSGDSLSIPFEKKITIKHWWFENLDIDMMPICVLRETLYNLTDTTRFIYPVAYCGVCNGDSLGYGNEKEKLYAERLSDPVINCGTSSHDAVILRIDDALLKIMEKDAAMPEQFKDYYK